MSVCNISSYKCSNKGTLLPLVNEHTWPLPARTVVYTVGLLWIFLAVSIIADIFMQSIEVITSKTRIVKVADTKTRDGYSNYEIKVWNNTVANLTLMALGSSAPEILLSAIEIVFNGFKAGDLGPGTIVGSAAFNMLVITSVCIVAIPKNECRRIEVFRVFAVTSAFSILAYVWLVIILLVITPQRIEIWESVVTFLLFPVLVIVAYITDRGFSRNNSVSDSKGRITIGDDSPGSLTIAENNDKELQTLIKKIISRPDLNLGDVSSIAAKYVSDHAPHSRGWYRINAVRALCGGQKLAPSLSPEQKQLLEHLLENNDDTSTISRDKNIAVIEFMTSSIAVTESCGHVSVKITRNGNLNSSSIFRIESVDGTAKAGDDYRPIKWIMSFQPNKSLVEVQIEIIDDDQWEPDEIFFLRLSVDNDDDVKVGPQSVCQVTILNDDNPGKLEFSGPSFLFKESCETACIPVKRFDGVDGRISVRWRTSNMTAIEGRDFIGREGILDFDNGEIVKTIHLKIINNQESDKDEHFNITLSDATGSAVLGRVTRTVITIVSDNEFRGLLSRVTNLTRSNLNSLKLHRTTWKEQFRSAMNVNGGDLDTATFLDYLMHFLTFAWKLIFAFVPPSTMCGGWLTFVTALIVIGLLTAVISDLATIFGCLVGLKDSVTAITIVALGTSLPDLFASKQAAIREIFADNSIGNVTGSNSVNVFLGLGVSWLIASIFWGVQNKPFIVPVKSLAFNVILFVIAACLCTALLVCRRRLKFFGRAELGGPTLSKCLSAIFGLVLWLLYTVLSSLQTYQLITVNL